MNFNNFNLSEELLKALDDMSYENPTPIQEQSLEHILDGKDLLGIAQTGTGKTATFSLPILQKFLENEKEYKSLHPRAVILAPTRELCSQIGQSIESFSRYTKIKTLVVHGGVSPVPQIEALKEKVDILIATPGRLADLIEQKDVFLDDIEFFVLDEVDNIIQMGLGTHLRKIIKKLSRKRQNLFFSATMNKELRGVAEELLDNPVIVEIEEKKINLNIIDHNVLFVTKDNKNKALVELLNRKDVKRGIIFTNSKATADNLVRSLRNNNIKSEALHSGKSNTHREKVVKHLRFNEIKFLIATDLASRGLDFLNITHVINFEVPLDFEAYTHRVGRVGRAGRNGVAFTLCCLDERARFAKIEQESKVPITVVNHEYHSNMVKSNGKGTLNSSYKPKKPKRRTSSGYNNRMKKKR